MSAIPIYTFSGTGNTLHAVRLLQEQFQKNGKPTSLHIAPFSDDSAPETMPGLFGFAGAVIGFSMSRILLNVASALPRGQGQQVFILMTSAGGNSPTNQAAHYRLQRILEKKGYDVSYIRNLTMGSNWVHKFDDAVNKALSDVVNGKMEHMADEILKGIRRDPKPSAFLRFFSWYIHWNEENFGARFFGKGLKAGPDCNQCGLCIKQCPAKNISQKKDSVHFGWKCAWCMKCIYQCPTNAIRPRLMGFSAVKGGYLHRDVLKLDGNLPISAKGKKMLDHHEAYLNDVSL